MNVQYKLNRLYPGDERFRGYNFNKLPLYEILNALKYGEKFLREDRHAAEIGTAVLTALTINMNRDPKSSAPPTKPKAFFHFRSLEEDTGISKEAARAFFDLANSGDLPPWALQQVHKDLDDFAKLEDNTLPVPKDRALVGKGCLIIAPKIINDEVHSSLVIWENPAEYIELVKVEETRHTYVDAVTKTIVIKSEMNEAFTGYSTGNYFDIIENG